MIELWRRLTLQWMSQCELQCQRQFMESWSAWTRFKHSLIVLDKSREADSE